MVEWQYIVLFLISLIPFLDVFSVIPVSIALGMSPLAVAIISFLGNFIMVMSYVRFFIQITEWLTKRRAKKKRKIDLTKIETKVKHTWEKHGLPVFALGVPFILATDITTLLALRFGSAKIRVIAWMGVSLVIWTVVIAAVSVYILRYINWI